MSAPYIIPFNQQPVNTGAGSSTYTVPSGKYARLTYNLYAVATVTCSIATNSPVNLSNSDNLSGSVWLKAGDAITVGTSVPSGTSGSGAGISGSASASILLNATTFAQAIAGISSSGVTAATLTLGGSTGSLFMYEEYNAIT